MPLSDTDNTQENPRKRWLSLLAKAPKGRIATLLDARGARPDFEWLRPPETGSVMVRGRAGATGDAFNLGEMTVTRCTLKLANGAVGHGYVQGRTKPDAEAAALVDALMQTEAAEAVSQDILAPLTDAAASRRATRASKAQATKVDFFTMVRGED